MTRITALSASLVWWLLSILPAYGAVEVFVSVPPQKWLAEKIGGDLVTCHVLVGEGRDPHTYEPTPKQMKTLAGARIWFILDMEFENRLVRKVADAAPNLLIVDTAKGVKKRAIEGHEEEVHEERHEHTHDINGLDPHIWLSPAHLQSLASVMVRTLIDADPDNSSRYEENFRLLGAELTALDDSIKAMLEPFAGATFYVFHPSFGYFADQYGLVQEPIEVGGKAPTPRQLSSLIKKARRDGVKIIFVQPQFDPKSAASVAAAIGGSVVHLDALSEKVDENLQIIAVRIKSALQSGSGGKQ